MENLNNIIKTKKSPQNELSPLNLLCYDFLAEISKTNKGICWCGSKQIHELTRCNLCGQEFEKIKLARWEIIKRYARNYELHRSKNGLYRSIKFHYELYKRKLGYPTFKEFENAYYVLAKKI